jgi:membrane associated rhomboid family serine protease
MIVHDDRTRRHWPWVTLALIAICAAVFAWEIAVANPQDALASYWLVPSEFFALGQRHSFLQPELYVPFFTATFLHADVLHLLVNMVFLGAFGDRVEDRMGALRFAAFFLAGGALASATHVAAHPRSVLPVVGASGAIAAVMGCFFLLQPRAQVTLLFPPIRVPALLFLALWFALQLAHITFLSESDPGSVSAAWWAHSGGFAYGMAVAVWLRLHPPARRRRKR